MVTFVYIKPSLQSVMYNYVDLCIELRISLKFSRTRHHDHAQTKTDILKLLRVNTCNEGGIKMISKLPFYFIKFKYNQRI